MYRQQLAQGGRGNQRGIAVQHQYLSLIRDRWRSLRHSVAGTQLLGLQHPGDLGIIQSLLQQLTAVTINQMDGLGPQLVGGVDHMADHGTPGNRVQDFR